MYGHICMESGKAAFIRAEAGITYFTENLSLTAIVFIKVRLGGITAWTLTVIIDVAGRTSPDRLYSFNIAPLNVRNVITIVPDFVVKDLRKFINFKFLVFWGVGIIEHPLLKRNKSANKIKKFTDNFIIDK